MDKPEKPYPEFPLYSHNCGKWAKKIKGKTFYFGTWDQPDLAIREYDEFIKDAPKEPQRPSEATDYRLTIEDACDHFLCHKESHVASRELSARSFRDYKLTCKRFSKFLGYEKAFSDLTPQDFASYREWLSQRWNPVNVGNEVTRILTMIKWLKGSKMIGDIEVSPCFRKPSELVMRRYRRSVGKKLFTPKDIHSLLDESGVNMRAMILLGINCGFQNSDVERVPTDTIAEAINSSWIEYPREKTEMERRCPLWEETLVAIKEASRVRRKRKKSSSPRFFFLRADGTGYSGENNDIAKLFRATREHAMLATGGFSWLRKTFETVASACCDQVAVNYIMGHVDASMAAVYRQEVWDERLVKATDTVHDWLWPDVNMRVPH